MPPRILLLLLLWQMPLSFFGQNKQIAYDFPGQLQALMLNPGTTVDYDMHIGVPLLSDAYLDFGASPRDASYNSIFSGTDNIDEILRNVYDLNPDENDVFIFNQHLELISFGKRLGNGSIYLSGGMYQEFNGFAGYPDELAELYMNGNDQDGNGLPEYEEEFGFGQLNGMGELLGVFHLGLNWQRNERLSLGLRLKIYSGSLGVQSVDNDGSYFLSDGGANYVHNLTDMNLTINTSGVMDAMGNRIIGTPKELLGSLFFAAGNLGAGVDLGFTYEVSNHISVSGSIIDLGLTNYKSQVTTYQLNESSVDIIDQVYFDPPFGQESSYWKDKIENYALGLQLPLDTLATKFRQIRAPKVYAGLSYNIGEGYESAFRNVRCENCLGLKRKRNTVGLQLFSEFRPTTPLWAVTAYYYRDITKNLSGKFTYTVDRFSYYNLGLGLSYRFKSFQVFTAVDNLLDLPKVKDSNYQSFQLGMSFVFNK